MNRGTEVPRSRLLELFSDDRVTEPAARRRLNTAVWRLRCAFEPDGFPRKTVIASTTHRLAIDTGCRAWADVVEFEDACEVSHSVDEWLAADASRLQVGVELYAGPFLEGIYDDWVLAERARLADLHMSALLRLVHWHERRDEYELALRHGRTAVQAEPLREDLHRLVMRLYRRIGLPEMAQRQYESCRSILRDELGVEPLPETWDAGVGPDRAAAATRGPLALQTLRTALPELEKAREEIRLISSRLDHSIKILRDELATAAES